MPNGLGGNVRKPEPLPAWYTLEPFLEAFQRHFQSVEVVAYPGEEKSPRTLVLCTGKKERDAGQVAPPWHAAAFDHRR